MLENIPVVGFSAVHFFLSFIVILLGFTPLGRVRRLLFLQVVGCFNFLNVRQNQVLRHFVFHGFILQKFLEFV